MLELIPNLTTTLFMIINFLITAYVLGRFVFRPLMAQAQERTARREELLEEAREERQETAALREEWESRVSQAEEQAASIVEEAQEDAERERKAVLQEAEEEVERILAEAYTDAARVRQQAVEEFHREMLDAILDISGMVIRQVAPEEVHRSLVQQLSDRIWEMGRSEMERVESLRRSLGERTPTAHVMTARSLSQELRSTLARTFTALADRNVNLDIEVDPDLVAGARVRLGDLVVDNSIAGELHALEGDAERALRERLSHE